MRYFEGKGEGSEAFRTLMHFPHCASPIVPAQYAVQGYWLRHARDSFALQVAQ
ncbi:hypothetical protein Mapa_010448 [Marchantia paleacea]|nr:hypothetical protein Mapa_010448 [Marchantia paleacea]